MVPLLTRLSLRTGPGQVGGRCRRHHGKHADHFFHTFPSISNPFPSVLSPKFQLGAIVLALARDWPIPMAVKFGLAAGAACVMTPGSELCRRSDTERLFVKMVRQANAVKYS